MSDKIPPYDAQKTASLIQTSSFYVRMPGSEFITEIADQLKSAEKFVADTVRAANESSQAVTSLQASLKNESTQHEKTRDLLKRYQDVLEKIAEGEKNPKQLADEVLNPDKEVKKPKKKKSNAEPAVQPD